MTGECSFEHKATAAERAGALGLIVYNSPKGIYQGRNFALKEDYDCNNGHGYVKGGIDGPVWEEKMTAKIPTSCADSLNCASKRCLFTNETSAENGTKVCCGYTLP